MLLFMRKEILAAIVMSIIIGLFYIGTQTIEGEAAILPKLLLVVMGIINVLQYILAIHRYENDVDMFCMLRRYPFRLVGVLFLFSVAYVLLLLPLGFYFSSFLFLLFGSLAGNPEPVTLKIFAIRAVCSLLFVLFLWGLFSYSLGVVIPGFSLL